MTGDFEHPAAGSAGNSSATNSSATSSRRCNLGSIIYWGPFLPRPGDSHNADKMRGKLRAKEHGDNFRQLQPQQSQQSEK